MKEIDYRSMTHEELVQAVYRITHQLDYETQQKLKDKIESEKMAAAS